MEVNKLVKLFNEAEEKRNQTIHSAYGKEVDSDNDGLPVRIKLIARQKHGLKITQTTLSENELKDIDNLIVRTIQELFSLYNHLFDGEQMKIG